MSGSSENIVKACGAVWSRLFDHRQFLQGEIAFFNREFAEKRGDREVENLFEILEKSTEIKDSQVDKVNHSAAKHLPDLQQILAQSNELCEKVLANRASYDPESSLKAKSVSLESQKKQFEEDLAAKYKATDERFAEKEKILREYYEKLTRQLEQSTSA